MRTTVEFEVENVEGKSIQYRSTQFGASEGLKVLKTLMRIAGKSAGSIVDAFDLSTGDNVSVKDVSQGFKQAIDARDMNFSGAKVGEAIVAFCDDYDAAGGVDFIIDLLKHTQVRLDGTEGGGSGAPTWAHVKDCFDLKYQGNYMELFMVVWEVIKLNFMEALKRPFVK